MESRWFRTSGILLMCLLAFTIVGMRQYRLNTELHRQLLDQRRATPVIVVPGGMANQFDARDERNRIEALVLFIAQTLNTYTHQTLAARHSAVVPFESIELQDASREYFERKTRDARATKSSSVFIPEHGSLSIRPYAFNGEDMRDVTITGVLQTRVSEQASEVVPLRLNMTFRRKLTNPALNPYGFELVKYRETLLTRGEANAPTRRKSR